MRFMVQVRAGPDSEAGKAPETRQFEAMLAFNQEMADAGVLKGGEGLHPSARGARIAFRGEERVVMEGPFADPRELIAGFWIIEAGSLQEAIDWMKRCPDPEVGGESVLEIRQIFSNDDFGEALTPELREQEERMRAEQTGG